MNPVMVIEKEKTEEMRGDPGPNGKKSEGVCWFLERLFSDGKGGRL